MMTNPAANFGDGVSKMHRAIAFVAALCVGQLLGAACAQVASTQMVEARELLGWCADGSPAGSAACTAYIMGIADAVAASNAVSCPGNSSRAQIREVVVRFMRGQQESHLGLPAGIFVTAALRSAFPCR